MTMYLCAEIIKTLLIAVFGLPLHVYQAKKIQHTKQKNSEANIVASGNPS